MLSLQENAKKVYEMTVIRWKFKNIIVLALLGALCLALYFMSTSKNLDTILYFIGVRASRDCNRNLRWIQDKRPLIGKKVTSSETQFDKFTNIH